MGHFSIRVVNDDGKPVRDIKVVVDFGLLDGDQSEYRDSDGWVEFNNHGDYVSAKFYVDGHDKGTHSTYNGGTHSFTI